MCHSFAISFPRGNVLDIYGRKENYSLSYGIFSKVFQILRLRQLVSFICSSALPAWNLLVPACCSHLQWFISNAGRELDLQALLVSEDDLGVFVRSQLGFSHASPLLWFVFVLNCFHSRHCCGPAYALLPDGVRAA